MRLIHNHKPYVSEPLISMLSAALAQQRGLGGDNDLGWEHVLLIRDIVRHLHLGIALAEFPDLVHCLPHQLAEVTNN